MTQATARSRAQTEASGERSGRSSRHRALTLLMLLAAAACYLAVVTARHGPTPGWDTGPLTAVTTELSTGDLRAAASNSSLPNPPGYALLASPFVVALRPVIGSPVWCTTGNPSAPRHAGPKAVRSPAPAGGTGDCGQPAALGRGTAGSPPPPWYHSQGMLGVLGWLVLAVGALALLRAAGADSLGRTAGLLVFLAFLPAASSAIVQLYHPQDIVSLGLALAGLAQVLRCRWVLAGLLFGVAFLTKQFAILVLLPALAAAPDRKSRLAIVTPAAAVFAAGLLPFLVSAPRATFDNFSGISGGGALAGATVLTELGVTGSVGSAVARDAPVVFAVVVCLWARRRIGLDLARPVCLVALALACVGSRLVFESVLFPYYLLGTSVIFFLLDLVARRSPHRSLAWSAAAAFFVALRPANRALDAVVTLVLAVLGVLSGLAELRVVRRQPISQPPSLVPTLADDPS